MAQSVSAEFRAILGKSREQVSQVEILDSSGAPVLTSDTDGPSSQRITVSQLSVTVDRSRSVRGDASCVIDVGYNAAVPVSPLIPTMSGSLLSPVSGATFRVRSGFRLPSGTVELVECGTFDLESCKVDEVGGGIQISIGGQDLMGRLDVADIYKPIPFNAGDSFIELVKFLVLTSIPGAEFMVDTTPYTIPFNGTLNPGRNRLAEIVRILKAIGMELRVHPTGPFEIRYVPTTADAPAWVLSEGQFSPVVSGTSSMDRSRVINGVIAEGQNLTTDTKCYGEVWNTDLSDPTHFVPTIPVQTLIGPRPAFITSEFLATDAQCVDAATAELRNRKGLMQRGEFTTTVNPAMNVGDVTYVDRPSIGIVDTCLIQRVEFTGQNDTMKVACEERRV